MGLETATYISDLVATNPVVGDNVSTADDHLRLIKAALLATFPNIAGAVTPTHTELNYVDGVTSAIQTQLSALQTSGTSAFTLSGFASGPTGDFIYVKSGNIVAIYQPAATGTSNANTLSVTSTPLPAAIRPTRAQRIPRVLVMDNGSVPTTCYATINTDGTITYGITEGATNTFTTSGTKGLAACSFVYLLN